MVGIAAQSCLLELLHLELVFACRVRLVDQFMLPSHGSAATRICIVIRRWNAQLRGQRVCIKACALQVD